MPCRSRLKLFFAVITTSNPIPQPFDVHRGVVVRQGFGHAACGTTSCSEHTDTAEVVSPVAKQRTNPTELWRSKSSRFGRFSFVTHSFFGTGERNHGLFEEGA